MIYLSKGTLYKCRGKDVIWVRHIGLPVRLAGAEAETWLNGRRGFAVSATPAEDGVIRGLVKKWLAECEPEHDTRARYWILTRCSIFPKRAPIRIPFLNGTERLVLTWIKKAGFHLRMPELVFLMEKGIKPVKPLLHGKNKRALIRKIYPACVVIANQLENRMQHVPSRNKTVNAVMSLLRKKRVILN